jgi:signal transduction histidine kinase
MMMRVVEKARSLSLAAQFALAGGVVILLSMLLVGRTVALRIEESVVRNAALTSAQYIDSIIAPLSQDIADADQLSPGARRALDEIFQSSPFGDRVVSYKLWTPGGLVVYASDPQVTGQKFEVSAGLSSALNGIVHASFEDLNDEEDKGERALGIPLLEIYSPIREVWSGKVIGAAEFYENAAQLQIDLTAARRNAWATVAAVFSVIGALLYLIVLGGSRTIERQRRALDERMHDLAALSDHNRTLRERVQGASARSSAMNDQALRRLAGDLHDGPAQLLGFAALRLDKLREAVGNNPEVDAIERAVKDAIREVRTISRGISLPDIANRGACEIVRGVADAHQARSGTEVAFTCDMADDVALSEAIKICLYRFVQEGLNNAWRHAEGRGQEVRLTNSRGRLRLAVRDTGPGYGTVVANGEGVDHGMGLSGLQDRVESLGGTLTARNLPEGGAELVMELETA